MRREKNICCPTFFIATNITKLNIILFFWTGEEKNLNLFTKNSSTFYPKLSKIWVKDPRSGKNLFRIPGPEVKKTPDPRSGFGTLNLKIPVKDHSRGNPAGRPRLLRGLRQTVHAARHSLRAHAQGAQPGTGNGRPEQVQPPEVAVLCGPRCYISDLSRTCEQRGTVCGSWIKTTQIFLLYIVYWCTSILSLSSIVIWIFFLKYVYIFLVRIRIRRSLPLNNSYRYGILLINFWSHKEVTKE